MRRSTIRSILALVGVLLVTGTAQGRPGVLPPQAGEAADAALGGGGQYVFELGGGGQYFVGNPGNALTLDSSLLTSTVWIAEPGTLVLLGLGAAGLLRRRR